MTSPAIVDYSSYVQPFHGTVSGGNMFPGVVAGPFAPVKLGPDVANGTTDAYSGYLQYGTITGFSMVRSYLITRVILLVLNAMTDTRIWHWWCTQVWGGQSASSIGRLGQPTA